METNELKQGGLILAALFAILWAAFYKESFLIVLRTELALVWMFLLPGYAIFRKKDWALLEKIVMGALVAGAVYGIASYYLGLLGLNVKWHIGLIPLVVMLCSLLIQKQSKPQENKKSDADSEPKGNQSAEPVDGNGHKDES